MRASLLLILTVVLCGACGGETPVAPEPVGAAAPAAVPGEPCPECRGSGVSPRTGDGRACLLCDGQGACPICLGEGHVRDEECTACDGEGRCPGCHGDGRLSRAAGDIGATGAALPGQCAFCRYGQGQCPGCAGRGTLADGRTCAQCDGERWCAVCRGSGVDGWCGGTGLCPSCRGHGRMVSGEPVADWPPLRVVLPDGKVIEVRLLSVTDRYLSWERDLEGGVRRETVLVRDVDPVTVISALRRFATDAGGRLNTAEYALAQGEHYLFVARSEIDAAGRLSESLAAESLKRRVNSAWRTFLANSSAAAGEVPAETESARIRREAAEASRYRRLLRRAVAWRVRSETLLVEIGVGLTERLRALRAAEEAWRVAARAANHPPAASGDGKALAEVGRARHLRCRALVAAADVLLAAQRPDRARAIAMLALAVEPDDEGARRYAAVVEEALARSRTTEEKR